MLAGPPEERLADGGQRPAQTGEGPQDFRKTWQDEGATPVMQLCFGTEIAAEQLMDEAGFQEACQLLYGPLLAQLR